MDGQAIIDDKVINNTLMNKVSVNEDSFFDNRSLIAGFPEGRIIKVTYFSQNHPIIDTQSKPADVNMMTYNDVHISWTQIRNFEIRIQSDLSFEYSSDTNRSTTTSQGIVLPGFVPRVGDVFLYMMRNGKIGLFYVSEINRLALGQETYHRIDFTMQQWLDTNMRARFQKQTTAVFYFDKEKFLTGNVAFMTTEGYIDKKELLHIRREIVQNYMDRFYDTEFSSFMNPDKVYDPYVVEFWNRKVSCELTTDRPIQLFCSIQNYKKTIWAALTNSPIKNIKNLAYTYRTEIDFHTFWDVNITALIGHQYIVVGNERGAIKNPTINRDGTPNAINSYPYNLGYYEPWRSKFQENSFDQMDMDRFWFYRGFLPFRKCAPHQHAIDYTTNPGACNPDKCKTCSTDARGHHHPKEYYQPPFPIVSSEELEVLWRRMNHIPPSKPLTPKQEAALRGYLLWYRTEYPGTLSWKELEKEWRGLASIGPHDKLTEEQEVALKEYVESYRSNYLPVLHDRELEYMWRMKKRVPLDKQLSASERHQLALFIKTYRELHGLPPKEERKKPFPEIGTPVTIEEMHLAESIADDVQQGEMIFDEFVKYNGDHPFPHMRPHPDVGIVGKAVVGKSVVGSERPHHMRHRPDVGIVGKAIVDKSVVGSEHHKPLSPMAPIYPESPQHYPSIPRIYHHRHTAPNQHIHCHSICHAKCQCNPRATSSSTDDMSDTYVLSKEFYLGSTAMSPFERLIYDALTNKEVSPRIILEAVSGYLEWDDETAFYQHLLAIYLIDKALFWLKFHS